MYVLACAGTTSVHITGPARWTAATASDAEIVEAKPPSFGATPIDLLRAVPNPLDWVVIARLLLETADTEVVVSVFFFGFPHILCDCRLIDPNVVRHMRRGIHFATAPIEERGPNDAVLFVCEREEASGLRAAGRSCPWRRPWRRPW